MPTMTASVAKDSGLAAFTPADEEMAIETLARAILYHGDGAVTEFTPPQACALKHVLGILRDAIYLDRRETQKRITAAAEKVSDGKLGLSLISLPDEHEYRVNIWQYGVGLANGRVSLHLTDKLTIVGSPRLHPRTRSRNRSRTTIK